MASETHGSILLSTADSVSRMLMKKLDSQTGFKPSEWTDNINLLGALPIRTASGTIAHFEDGADDVPMKSVVANIVPIQSGTGDPSPSNPRPISGTSVLNVEQRGNNYFDQVYPNIDSNVNYKAVSVPNGTYTMETTCPAPNGLANLFFLTGNVQSGASTGTNGVWKGQTRTITVSDGYFTVAYRNANGANPQNYFTIVFDKSTAYTFDLGQEIMGGSADVVGGTGTDIYIKHEFSSSEIISDNYIVLNSSTNVWYWTQNNLVDISGIDNDATHYCNVLKQDNNAYNGGVANAFRIISGNRFYITLSADDYPTKEDFRNAIDTLKPVVVLKKTTPESFTFTGQPINSYLGVNNLYVDSGEVLDVEYRADIDLLISELGG